MKSYPGKDHIVAYSFLNLIKRQN